MATNDCIETAGSSGDSALIHHRRRQLISLNDLNETSSAASTSSSTTTFGTEDFTLNSNSSLLLTGDNPELICDDENKQIESLNTMNRLNSISDINNQLIDNLRICLFGAALFSGKSTSLLKPYPDKYFDSELGEIRSVELMQIYQNIPSSESILSQNNNNEIEDKLSESIQLLDWIVSYGAIEFRHIRSIDQIEPDQTQAKQILLENLLTQTESKSNVILLEFRQNRCPNKLEKFQKLKNQFGSFYAFHGSALENFHSILHNGLANSLNKRSLFGFGTYLSSKLCVAIQYSPFGLNPFRRSLKLFGSRLSCVALCEIIDHPDVQAKKNQQKDMPNTYYVVPNNDLIRIAYILVYSSLSSSSILDSAKFNFQSSCPKSEEAFPQSPEAKKSASVSNAQSIHPVPTRTHRAVRRAYPETREANTSYSNLFLIVIIVCFIVIGLLMTRKSNINQKFEF